ncbi:OmpP1/FadL family transporter [Stenoxybacter acetivorans]|uniref:OmpP1/FadL family transporter n=1 Tax=Stenoxybacter acetivorans TaxID=422441 RepID=UPI00055C3A47|nr:OmpP1/FadL family transporter [Stenoxybacter acetivorans]
MTTTLPQTLKKSALIISGLFLANQALASGYHFGTQSVSSQSTANASAAEAADPSTLFYNPAGLTKLEGTQASININVVMPSVKYKDAKAYYPGMPGGQQEINTAPDGSTNVSRSGKITDDAVLAPHGYVSHQVNDRVFLGLGVYVPFGSSTEYQKNSVLRYNLNQTGLETIAVQPTVAYKINDQHSVAVGLVAQHTKAELRQYANFGAFIGANGMADGSANVKGSDWGFGYNLAWLWDINDNVRMGVNYRSKVSHNIKGDAKWLLEGPAFANPSVEQGIRDSGYVSKEGAQVKVATPESLSVHGMWKVNPKWNVFGDVTWTRHSRFNKAHLTYDNGKVVANPQTGGQTTSNVTTLNPQWRNTYKVSLGASYQVSEPLQLRFGWAYDQSPVKNDDLRLATLPDSNRMWFSVGGKYDFNKNNTVNLAYSYLKIHDSQANLNGWCGGTAMGPGSEACVSSRTNGTAKFKSHASIVGVQYTYKF